MKVTLFLTTALLLIMLSVMVLAEKPGSCPPIKPGDIGICAITCNGDYSCNGDKKCCPTACGGTICTEPEVKRGFCPAQPTGRWVCSSTCRSDKDCRGNKKCCKNRCGAMVCQNPVPVNMENYDYYAVPPVIASDNDS